MEEAGNVGGEDEREAEEQPPPHSATATSLFPLPTLFPLSTPQTEKISPQPQWLCNTSFTVDVPLIPDSGAPELNLGNDSDTGISPEKPSYSFVEFSVSELDTRHGSPEKRRKKKRKRKIHREETDDASRKSAIRAWAGPDTKPSKDYYFDTRGDRDNLAFGCLYRMDVARYKLHNPVELSGLLVQNWYRLKQINFSLNPEGDIDALDGNLKTGGRYWSTKYSTVERNKDLKHMRVISTGKSSTLPGEFIHLTELHDCYEETDGSVAKVEFEESWEDEVIRKTKEFNKMTMDFPHDEKVWVAFAKFQDKISSMQPKKAARLQTLEKKISVLEKAVELNPDNEELLLNLLKAYQSRDSTALVVERWERTLVQHSDSCKLWKEFLHFCQGDFSRFKVSDMRKIFGHAIQALSTACRKLCRQGLQTAKPQSAAPELVQLEKGLVDVFVSLCRFEWQAGYQELATGLFQAEIEYGLFCPSLLLSEQSKQRLFEHFWNADGARVGEDGAIGWSSWLEKEEENRRKVLEDSSQETEVGGWTGWSEPSSRSFEIGKKPQEPVDFVDTEDTGEDSENENIEQGNEMESLLEKLGINVNAETDTEVQDTAIWHRWSEEEISRDFEQWMPVRGKSDGTLQNEGEEQLSRLILFEDVGEYLFSLSSEEARFCLVSQFIDFFGGRVSQWVPTNSPSWMEKILSLETLSNPILEELQKVQEVVAGKQRSPSNFSFEFFLGSSNDITRRTNIMKFLRNAILLCLNAFPRNYILEEAVLVAEQLLYARANSCTCSVASSRPLAKSLLKNDRQDLLLCGLYARSEAAAGNIDLARKVFEMALSSVGGLPLELQVNAPLLYFWFAEMELANCNSGDSFDSSTQRAIYVLSCLGSGIKYMTLQSQPSSMQLLRARQGFREQIKNLRSTWAHGDIKEHSIALVCSAALFEELTAGWAAATGVFEEAFSMTLPERRSQSCQLELLFQHYIGMLQKHLKQSKLSRSWETILRGLRLYPYNPKVFAAFIEVSCLYTVPHKLRRILDEFFEKKPSIIVWLLALSFELGKAGSHHRIHGLFERALMNDELQKSVLLWRCYLAYELQMRCNPSAARRIFFRAIHACPWSKMLWLEGFQKLSAILTAKELSDLQEVMRDKELHLRTDIYEILLQDEIET